MGEFHTAGTTVLSAAGWQTIPCVCDTICMNALSIAKNVLFIAKNVLFIKL